MKAKQRYQCPACETLDDSEYMAQRCCRAREVYVCGGCKKVYREDEKQEAETCCFSAAVVQNAYCHFCNRGPLSGEDLRDSAMVGCWPRCRSCILSVAPEMLTAEQIAYGRAA